MRLRRRILRRFFRSLFEVVFSHLQVVLHRHGHTVADLGRGDMDSPELRNAPRDVQSQCHDNDGSGNGHTRITMHIYPRYP